MSKSSDSLPLPLAGEADRLSTLCMHIRRQVEAHLTEFGFSAAPHLSGWLDIDRLRHGRAMLGVTPHHPLDFFAREAALAGSYLLGPCRVIRSVAWQSDLRGDELKRAGDEIPTGSDARPLWRNERIHLRHSMLLRTLVHNHNSDPRSPDELGIQDSLALPFANIHGSSAHGCFLGPLATLDLTSARDSCIGAFSYVCTGRLEGQHIAPGRVWLRSPDGEFEFYYRYAPEDLEPYLQHGPGEPPTGILDEIHRIFRPDLEQALDASPGQTAANQPLDGFVSPGSLLKGSVELERNVLVAQRAYLEDCHLGPGSNAQENCCLIRCRLEGEDITAHGGVVWNCRLGSGVFVGFNSLLRGRPESPLTIGDGCIIMPHSILDADQELAIPAHSLVWGLVRGPGDLATQTVSLAELKEISGKTVRGNLRLTGSGEALVNALTERISHILESNGALFDGARRAGHAQLHQGEAHHLFAPLSDVPRAGLFPMIRLSGHP
jgi:carbonic anhydrase/acetyltransferase-like protein (isoleucine patch superfamily)